MNRLKKHWGIDSNKQLIVIFIVFAITGSLAVIIASPIMHFLNLSTENLYYWPLRILIIFPLYYIILLIVGWLFGEYHFFLQFAKKMIDRFRKKIN